MYNLRNEKLGDCCKYGNSVSSSMKGEEFLEYLFDQILMKDSLQMSQRRIHKAIYPAL